MFIFHNHDRRFCTRITCGQAPWMRFTSQIPKGVRVVSLSGTLLFLFGNYVVYTFLIYFYCFDKYVVSPKLYFSAAL